MILTIKLNLGANNYENQEFQTNEYDNIEDCYREQIIFLNGWLDFTSFAQPLLEHIQKILRNKEQKTVDIVREAREAVLKDRDEAIYGEKLSTHDQKIMREMIPKADVIIQEVLEDSKLQLYTEKVLDSDTFSLTAEKSPEKPTFKSTINWIINEGKKYKPCKFCDNLVSWNHDTNNYDHFNRAFKYLYPRCNVEGK